MMRVVKNKNLWEFHLQGNYIVITTNGFVGKDGSNVMGAGLAYQAKLKFADLPKEIGERIKRSGNHVYRLDRYRLFAFPTKHVWWENASIDLIEQSLQELVKLSTDLKDVGIVRVGCGLGNLEWDRVRSLMERYLDDKFVLF